MKLFITSSRGVYKYNLKNDNISQIISNWNKGIFTKPSKGFFGICLNKSKNEVIFASRENLSNEAKYDKSTDIIIHFYNFVNNSITKNIIIKNLFDVHQIAFYDNLIFITETGKNRIQVLNSNTNNIQFYIDVGKIRSDVNHINSISIDKSYLFIGLNNGHAKNVFKNAQLIKIPTSEILKMKSFDVLDEKYLENLNGVFHTHDMEKFDDDYLISSSNLGKIYSYNKKKFIKDINPWTRGITVSNTQLFIGKSGMGKRKFRHSRYYNGEIFVLDKFNLTVIKKIVISKIGQLNDIIYVDN